MRMYVLDNGIIRMPENTIYDGGSSREWIDIPIHTYLIKHPEGWVLFDAACDPDGMTKNWPEEFRQFPYVVTENAYLPQRIEQLGLKPEDIGYVVASHLHLDHAGCLKFFSNARVFVNSLELRKTLKHYVSGAGLDAHLKSDIESWLLSEINWHPVYSDVKEYEILPGLKILNLGSGHSWGMLGMLVELKESGKFLLVSDAVYSAKHLGPPEILPGILYDVKGYRETVEFIFEYAQAEKATILFGHDAEQFRGLVKSTSGYYE